MTIFRKIKICGINELKILEEINKFEIGFAGFIAYSNSPRFVDVIKYQKLVCNLSSNINSVLVVVNPDILMLEDYIRAYRPSFLQLHGAESIDFIEEIKAKYDLPIIKAIPAGNDIAEQIKHYQPHVEMLLFDTSHGGSFGGTGVSFDWALLEKQDITKHYFLSGGIGAHNVSQAIATSADFIDVSSSLESKKGVKDVAKIQFFMNIVRQSQEEKL